MQLPTPHAARLFSNRAEASQAAASVLAERLSVALAERGRATLVVSGGSTPVDCFHALAQAELDWGRVRVTLTDERCVAATHEASNERMVRRELLCGPATCAEFVSVTDATVDQFVEPFAAVLVGMGADGHFASIFPEMADLDAALSLDRPPALVPVTTEASPWPRVTMTLSLLCRSALIVLLAYGQDKRSVLEEAENFPVGSLLRQSLTPVRVLWAP